MIDELERRVRVQNHHGQTTLNSAWVAKFMLKLACFLTSRTLFVSSDREQLKLKCFGEAQAYF